MLSPSNNPPVTYYTRIGGKKYLWQRDQSTEEQQKSDTTKSIEIFLASVKKDSIGPTLAKLGAEILSMHDKHDYFMKNVNHKARQRMVDGKECMEEHTTTFIDDIMKGMKRRLGSINATTGPLPKDLADDMETWFVEELQAYQAWMKKRNTTLRRCFSALDCEMRKEHKEIRENDKKMLLEQLEAIKVAQDSAVDSYIVVLRKTASAQGVDIDSILAAVPVPVAVSVSCSAPSSSTTAATPIPTRTALSNDHRCSDPSGSKRRRLQDHYGSEN